MYTFIPPQITWSVNNRVAWNLYSKSKTRDSQLNYSQAWGKVSNVDEIYSTDVEPVNPRDTLQLQAINNLATDVILVKIWVKQIELNFDAYEYALKMAERVDPHGFNLGITSNYYRVLQNQAPVNLNREDWLFLEVLA